MAAKERAVRSLPLYVEVLGWLALLTAVALLSPGVVLEASAEPAGAAPVADGPSCNASEVGADHLALQVEQHIAQLRAQVEARAGEADVEGVVPLNNSGFNYRPVPLPPAMPSASGSE